MKVISRAYKKLSFFILVAGIIFALNIPAVCSDDIVGKIITKSEANTQFGTVLVSDSVSAEQVMKWVGASESHIMFNIMNNQVYVLTNNRKVVAPEGAIIQDSDTFHVYSTSKVTELLSVSRAAVVAFEIRANVFSLTAGEYTLEFSLLCPPYCN